MADPMAQYAQTQEYIKQNEGFKGHMYPDSVGKATIGYGFNTTEPRIARFIPSDVRQGKRHLTPTEADFIMTQYLMPVAINDAKTFAGNSFDSLDTARKQALVDVAYQLGQNRLAGFTKMQAALKSGDYPKAALELLDSDYAKQVPSRARRNAKLLMTGGL